MDFINISHSSALDIHRWYRIHVKKNLPYRYSFLEFHNGSSAVCQNFLNWYIKIYNCKLDVLVQNKNCRHSANDVSFHVAKVAANVKLFALLKPGIYICSPEFMFIQLSLWLDFIDLIKIGFEICGKYAYDVTQQKFIPTTTALTNVKKITKTLNNIADEGVNHRGMSKARKALEIIRDNSYSIQETNLYLKLCLDHKYGGYAVSNMFINQSIKLSNGAFAIAGQHQIIPDISNNKNKIAIEYDSDEFHDNQMQNRKDKRRFDALNYEGWSVYCFVPGQVNNITAFNKLAVEILKKNGQTARIRFKNFKQRQIQLFIKLNN